MENPNTYSPSDLIYLFLDGEADGVEQSMLFGMLAGNSELQAEFSEAVRIRAAVETERSETHPPAALTRDLFEKAGFGMTPAAAGGGAAPVVAPAVAGIFGRFGVPFLCAVSSALITALLFSRSYEERYDAMQDQIRRLASAGPVAAHPRQGEIHLADGAAERTTTPPTAAAPTRTASPPRNTHPASRFGAGRPVRTSTAQIRPNQFSETLRSHQGDTGRGDARTALVERAAPLAVAPEIREIPAGSALGASRTPRMESSSPLDGVEQGEEIAYPYSVQLRGMTDLRFFPERSVEKGAQPWFNNMSIGGVYHLTGNHGLGLELGQEYLPMYRFNGISVVKDEHISWIAGFYRFQTDPIEAIGGIRPFAQGGIGASESGPAGKGIVGVSYAPDRRVDLSIGVEGSTFLYHLGSAWYSTRKAGITYMMNVHF